MKTEQEQIEQIEKVLKDSVADYKHLKKKGVCYCYAETLIDHGYGDVSEYKAEIERLKEENERSRKLRMLGNNVTVEFLDDVVSEPSVDCKDIEKYAKQFRNRIISFNEKEVKQAQIDIINTQTDTINAIVKYCENPNHWRELKDCKLFGGKSDDLRVFLNGIFKEVDV
jgi:hypothetical protein